ncbi:MAG TPA: PA14 domain-containing protein, partial [Ilumatobacteraceae bacterium]
FTLDTDDGARMFIDNVAVIDSWTAARASVYTQFLTGVHTLRVEYNEKTGTARAALTTQFASVATVANGVTAVPSVKTNQPFFGELNVTLTNPSDVITAMSASFSIAQTPGVTYHGQYTDLPKSEMTESNQSCVGLVTYGFTLGHGVTIRTPGTWVLAAQWDGTGTPRVTTGDTWSVTTTTSKGTSTVSGTF